jgi:hypothetical protein
MVKNSDTAKQADDVNKDHSRSIILTLLPIIISLCAVYFTGITFLTAYRPYVGVVRIDKNIQTDKDGKPTVFSYYVVLKNTGVIPSHVHLITSASQVIKDDKVIPILPDLQKGGSIIIMPNSESTVSSWLVETTTGISISDILSGKSMLKGEIKISYEAIGAHWWNKSYHSDIHYKYLFNYVPPMFGFETGDAN